MDEAIGVGRAYRLFSYDKDVNAPADLHSFVATAGVCESWLHNLELMSARAARFDGFLVARGEMRNATLVWTRARQSAQHRFMFVNRGALQVSGDSGTSHTDGRGVGLIYPGKGAVALTTIVESDFTVFTFDSKAIRQVLQIIDTNFRNPLFSTADICTQLGVGRRTRERICATAGFAPAETIRARRAEHALKLLLSQPVPRPEWIWPQSGFSSNEAMRRSFIRFYGKTTRDLFTDGNTTNERVEIGDAFTSAT